MKPLMLALILIPLSTLSARAEESFPLGTHEGATRYVQEIQQADGSYAPASEKECVSVMNLRDHGFAFSHDFHLVKCSGQEYNEGLTFQVNRVGNALYSMGKDGQAKLEEKVGEVARDGTLRLRFSWQSAYRQKDWAYFNVNCRKPGTNYVEVLLERNVTFKIRPNRGGFSFERIYSYESTPFNLKCDGKDVVAEGSAKLRLTTTGQMDKIR